MRIYAEADDRTISEMVKFSKKMRISRNELILQSINQFLHPSTQASQELDQLRTDIDQKGTELVQARTEADQLRTELDQARSECDQFKSDFNNR